MVHPPSLFLLAEVYMSSWTLSQYRFVSYYDLSTLFVQGLFCIGHWYSVFVNWNHTSQFICCLGGILNLVFRCQPKSFSAVLANISGTPTAVILKPKFSFLRFTAGSSNSIAPCRRKFRLPKSTHFLAQPTNPPNPNQQPRIRSYKSNCVVETSF